MDCPQSLALVSPGDGFEPVTSQHESCDIDHCAGTAYLIKNVGPPSPNGPVDTSETTYPFYAVFGQGS